MPFERRTRLLERLSEDGSEPDTKRLCAVSAEVTGMSGAGIMLMSGDVPRGSLCTTDEVSALVEELQFSLGEGPCVDAHRDSRPVLEPDLVEPVHHRWPGFAPAASRAGVRAIFGFPLRIGEVRLGALNLYRDEPGALSDEQHADALAMADIVTEMVLAMQAGAPPGQLAVELERNASLQYVVHQASGMVAVQLGVSVGQALIRLRGHAFAHDRPLGEVAADVVDRSLRFDAETGDAGPSG